MMDGTSGHDEPSCPLYTRRRRCWELLGAFYSLYATVWVVFGVLVQYFVRPLSSGGFEEKWSAVLPDLGATPGRALCMGLHFLGGSVITLLGVWQVCPASRRTPRRRFWHRCGGRAYVACSVLAACGGLGFIAQQRVLVGGWAMTASFTLYGLLVLVTALQTYIQAQKGNVEAHQRWALRTFSLGIASFWYRGYFFVAALCGFLKSAPAKEHHASEALYFTPFMQFDEWWFFLPNLFVVEWLVRAKDTRLQRVLLDVFLLLAGCLVAGVPAALLVHSGHHRPSRPPDVALA